MSFILNAITFKNFRNYSDFNLREIGDLTILVGENAIGKTNIIEGIELITSSHSFRNPLIKQFINWGKEQALIKAEIKENQRNLVIKLVINSEKKNFFINEKKKSSKEIKGIVPSVIFTPDDLLLIKGSNSNKRTALDLIGEQVSSQYRLVKRDYEKILQQKNNLLKEDCSSLYLESINETFIKIASQLHCYRFAIFKKMKPYIQDYYRVMSSKNEEIELSYIPSWEKNKLEIFNCPVFSKEQVNQLLSLVIHEKKQEEKKKRYSLFGPHNDQIEFFINGKNARYFGSQGQQRSLVLSFKIAAVRVIEDITGKKPILLLDDVMSELDEKRRKLLLSFINQDIQTFITTTDLRYFDEQTLKKATVVELG